MEELKEQAVIYMLKFSRAESRERDLRLMRGAIVNSVKETSDQLETVTLSVQLDGA